MLDLRKLFDRYNIPWRDNGPNCSKGNVNVRCPLCGHSDRSFHMAITEDGGYYYCFRNSQHGGQNTGRILNLLGIPSSAFEGVKMGGVSSTPPKEKNYSLLSFFAPAEESEEAVNYLGSRKFSDPALVCKKFNLRVEKEGGEWAGRLIIPLTVGWTGRSMRAHIVPRYKAYTDNSGFFLFSQGCSTVLICEGAIDCMRVATVTNQMDVIGKCRISVSTAIYNFLRERKYSTILNCCDGTVAYMSARHEVHQIRSYCTLSTTKLFRLPEGVKDFGEMTESEARRVLLQVN